VADGRGEDEGEDLERPPHRSGDEWKEGIRESATPDLESMNRDWK